MNIFAKISSLKWVIAPLCAVVLLGAGCSTQDAPQLQTKNTTVSVSWKYDAFMDSICLYPAEEVAVSLGFPNGPTDHLCLTSATSNLVKKDPIVGDEGIANMVLDNLKFVSEANGRIYHIDVLSVE